MEANMKTARLAGFFYLMMIVGLVISDTLSDRLIIPGDTIETFNNILNGQGLYITAFFSEAMSALFFLLAAWTLYVILKPVNQNLALLFLVLLAVGVAIECLNLINLIAVLVVIQGNIDLSAFQVDQLQSLAMFFLELYDHGFVIAQIFFGTWLFPLGYLVFKSTYLPKWIGMLLMADSFGIVFWFFQHFALPDYPDLVIPAFAIGFAAEFSLSMWLLIKGVNENALANKLKQG